MVVSNLKPVTASNSCYEANCMVHDGVVVQTMKKLSYMIILHINFSF